MLSVANFNMHCGMDGRGRPFDYVGAMASFDADVIVLEEAWTIAGEDTGQAEEAAAALGYTVFAHDAGPGPAHPAASGGARLVDRPALVVRRQPGPLHGRPATPAGQGAGAAPLARGRAGHVGHRRAGAARTGVETTKVLPLRQLRADGVRRAALVVDLTVAGRPVSVVGTHMPHIPYGSHRTWAELRRILRTEARPDAVLSGDMNTWGPLVRFFLPGWHRAVVGRTWPSWTPHSQIDHIVTRGALRPVSGEVLPDAGSDHRPIRTTLELT